ncbi:hypothetical protein BDV26DRAFT_259676 [Aspergillus bertholletiae]|uniref:Zn(2)-C6 fungal-type domain-containing protein n=1 Tax=Aspergillus bertholletiae TaxID=1226010 RepID=A0A5N7BCD5_9EURO|nr:hypothetical protein BDV26DRAFT_259676 [Aspergillus bertholletiae]
MVYCGRPSASCGNCRAKKKRCDKAVPGCGQCQRTGRECPGYRDLTSLIFRDESSHVINKVQARITKRDASRVRTPTSAGRSQTTASPLQQLEQGVLSDDPLFTGHSQSSAGTNALQANNAFPNANNTIPDALDDGTASCGPGLESKNVGNGQGNRGKESDDQMSIPPPFTLPLDMIALNYFLAHYIVQESPPSSGFLSYVPSILTLDDDNEILQGGILAVGFAGVAHSTRQADLRCRSRAMYTRTIKRMNRALEDPQTARQHSTIVTVLILSLYEFGESSLDGWDRHIQGATSMLALRGKAQFTTRIGLQIFRDIFSHLLINCLRMGSPIPAALRMIRAEAAKAFSASDPCWVTSSALLEVMDLYSQINPGGFDFVHGSAVDSSKTGTTERQLPIDELERYLSQALDIDHRLESRFSECSPEWRFTVVQLASPDPHQVHGGIYHKYHDSGIVGVWNEMRTCRVLANHAICHLLLRGAKSDPSWFFSRNYTDQLQETSQTMRRIRDDILASLPQQLSYFPFPTQQLLQPLRLEQYLNPATIPDSKLAALSTATLDSSFGFQQPRYTGVGVGAYFASWMLLLAGSMHTNSEDTRQWIITQLRHITAQAGLAQADLFASCIESNKVRPPLST